MWVIGVLWTLDLRLETKPRGFGPTQVRGVVAEVVLDVVGVGVVDVVGVLGEVDWAGRTVDDGLLDSGNAATATVATTAAKRAAMIKPPDRSFLSWVKKRFLYRSLTWSRYTCSMSCMAS